MKRIFTDEELKNDDKVKGHERRQKLLDALSIVAQVAIYVIPICLGIFYVLILGHKIVIGDWVGLEGSITSMLIPVITYLVGVMTRSGMLPK
ncbi:MAG TPA: hypothetical protein VK675_03910 [Candidatus Paceibacterota bacterium]|nr:hypothetical protein [Candidatus Paceibacterota bacterium]